MATRAALLIGEITHTRAEWQDFASIVNLKNQFCAEHAILSMKSGPRGNKNQAKTRGTDRRFIKIASFRQKWANGQMR
ncbi:hypothetical protein AJ80_00174 [Polytolypa hystricis UAMH7299]|uniref:Uncharacterized protein n=1 Tax=Polytolypa hystricis (strain UAMH7299) TaxID=1447883 RepID=A0A2B7Z4X7_POLH7|nr:hypothetical protein AJ80_00174 [Polytolypa hystricis UAMH7299]